MLAKSTYPKYKHIQEAMAQHVALEENFRTMYTYLSMSVISLEIRRKEYLPLLD